MIAKRRNTVRGLNEPIGFLIAAVRRRIKQALGSQLRQHRLTPQQFWILIALMENTGLSLRELAARLRMDDPTASRVVFTLVKRGFVEMNGDPTDRRRCQLSLGKYATAVIKELQNLAAAVRAAIIRGVSLSEQEAMRTTLRKIMANMDWFQRQEKPK
jgi:MarR family transcriptional regulator for hemolysin